MMDDSTLPRAVPTSPARGAGQHSAFTRFAWAVLGYLILVIQFGAWVRITGSGAGCGSHWPTCNGEVVPRAPTIETIIEYTHRVTSGLLGIVVVALALWATLRPVPQRVRAAAWITLAFTVLEAAIGAKLVLSELVARDDSVARAIVVAVHLVSTFTLTAAAGLVAWWSARPRNDAGPGATSGGRIALIGGCGLLVVVSMTGAITALGDTLFPVDAASNPDILLRLRGDLEPTAHFLVRLRIVHPILAVTVAGLLLWLGSAFDEGIVGRSARPLLGILRWAVIAQTAIGLANIAWGAPGSVQLVHLLCAQIVWLLLVFSTAEALRPTQPAQASAVPAP
jgi:heme A synthase